MLFKLAQLMFEMKGKKERLEYPKIILNLEKEEKHRNITNLKCNSMIGEIKIEKKRNCKMKEKIINKQIN